MTQAELLSSARLHLNATLRRSTAQPDRVLVRTAGGRQRLVLSPAQAAILTTQFAEPSTVPETLVRLLGAHSCPPLDEYYELVLQAQAAGVLVTGTEPTEYSLVRRWPVRLPVRAASWLGGTALAAGLLVLSLKPWGAPTGWIDWAIGWVLANALLAGGEALAGCVLAGAGCEVRQPQLHWKTLLPHFQIDTAEATMGGRACELAVAVLRAAPVAVGAAVIAWLQPGWLAPVLAGLLYVLAPWRGSAAAQWLEAWYGAPRFSIAGGSILEQRRKDSWAQWSANWAGLRLVTVLHWLIWTLLVATVFVRGLPGPAATLLAWFGPAGRLHPLVAVGIYSLAAAVVLAAGALSKAAIVHWWLRRKLLQPLRTDSADAITAAALQGDTAAILRQMALFQNLSEDDRTALAAAMKEVTVEKRAVIFQEDDPGDAFYIVLEGEIEVQKRLPKPANRTEVIGRLGAGSGFGEIALLEGTVRSATVRAGRRSRLLRLAKDDFDRLVVGRVGAARVRELLQYATFLARLVFLAGWPFDDLVRYAQKCASVRVPAGGVVLQRGSPNIWFYLIYDGIFEAREGGRVLRRMQPGDYFGEISLLGDIEATADVVAVEESRCLTMSRQDFLGFFAKDFRIGLRMEALAAQRLGSGLFRSR
jgi:CRP-like cAMP-binding protein